MLEWDPIDLGTADIRSLSLFRNGAKAGAIPRPLEITSTKISGLAIDTEYTFHLVLRTTAGIYSSKKLTIRTHKMTELSGITVTPGVLPAQLRHSLADAVERIGGKIVDTVRIDTTHFVCTEGRGREWERAVENNIPVVRPEWVEGCEREGRIVGVRGYYLNADPRLRQVGPGVGTSRRTDSQATIPRIPTSATTSEGPYTARSNGPLTGGTDASALSPGPLRDPGAPEPPTPPAKDTQSRHNGSTPALSSTAGTSTTNTTSERAEVESDSEEESKKDELSSSHNESVEGVQSPFDASHKDQEIPHRPYKRQETNDSFSEVQL